MEKVQESRNKVWDKLLKSRRGCLEKLRPRESLKPRDFPEANPRAKPPKVCAHTGPRSFVYKNFLHVHLAGVPGEPHQAGHVRHGPEGLLPGAPVVLAGFC